MRHMKELTRLDQVKSREMRLLVSQECTWHCTPAQDAVKMQNMPNQCLHFIHI